MIKRPLKKIMILAFSALNRTYLFIMDTFTGSSVNNSQ